jgi:two-component system, LytTR family, response regulator
MKKIKTLIIEDEAPARDILKHYLKDHPEVEILGECSDGFAGMKAIAELKPDLIFLDIQMPKLTGFEMLEILDERPEIIFTTAFDQFAIKAFELNAVDYLLKPVDKVRFDTALAKAIAKITSGVKSTKSPGDILHHLPESSASLTRIVVRKANSINIIPIDQVKYIEAQDDYVMIYHKTGKALKQQTMKFYEDNLPGESFARVHRSYIVRIEEINRLEPYSKDNYIALLHSGEKLPVSRSGYRRLRDELSF